jgi:hypothetical protein
LTVEFLSQADGAFVSTVGDLAACRKSFFASSTATEAIETEEEPTAVSLRTRLATAKARLKS